MNLATLTKSLTVDEGKKASPYLDSKELWTLGIGRCLERNPLTPEEWRWLLSTRAISVQLTEAGIQYLFAKDVQVATSQIKARCDFWDRLNDVRQNVLIEMVFQMGIDGVLSFNKMFAALRVGDFENAAREGLDSKWHRDDSPERARVLMERLRTGSYP